MTRNVLIRHGERDVDGTIIKVCDMLIEISHFYLYECNDNKSRWAVEATDLINNTSVVLLMHDIISWDEQYN